MKAIFRFFATFFAILMLCVSFTASATISDFPTDTSTEFSADVFETEDYVVKKGDTLSALAVRTDEKYTLIAKRNNIKNPNAIFVGQVITLKRSAATVLNSVAHVRQDLVVMGKSLQEMEKSFHKIKITLHDTQNELVISKKAHADKSTYLLSASIGLVGFLLLFIGHSYIQAKKIRLQHNKIFSLQRILQKREKTYTDARAFLESFNDEMLNTEEVIQPLEKNGPREKITDSTFRNMFFPREINCRPHAVG